jgi:hypothetical protein
VTTFAEKLAAAYADMGGAIKADKRNKGQDYDYVSAVAVQAKASRALAKHGLYIAKACSELLDWREMPTRSGSIGMAVIRQHVVITDGESSVETVAHGSGADSGDKAVMKAETAAMKYALAKALCVGLGDDPEADEATDRATQRKPPPDPDTARQGMAKALAEAKDAARLDRLEQSIQRAPVEVQAELRAMVQKRRAEIQEAA